MQTTTFLRLLAGALLLPLAAAAQTTAPAALDPQSAARYDQVRVSDLQLDLRADFARRTLAGSAELTLHWIDPAARALALDTRDLSIAKVQMQDARGRWVGVPFQLDPADPADADKGRALRIALQGQPAKLRIAYHTAPGAAALQWLTPQQTMSGKLPFMFSQSESINARSWVPLQDTPAVRFTYGAKIAAPAGMRVLMSAENDQQATGKGGWKFKMAQPIPSYLLAIAIGEIEVRSLGPRSAIYAEPARIAAAAYEMADTEKMIAAAEALYGPYRWGRYDMIVLPPSFPYGGMENPRLTFLTPTMIAGDRSLVDLIAHELAHSWSGNLVTNASWRHFWLNEGFTTYVTTRVVEALYGAEVAQINLQVEQEETLESLKKIAPRNQALMSHTLNAGPDVYADEGLVYGKGAWFLRTLEQRVGRAAFDPFLRGWFDQHAFQSVTSDQFVDYLRTNLLASHPDLISEAELEDWLYGPGIPASARREASPRLAQLDAKRAAWLSGALSTADLAPQSWIALEWMHFLNDIDNQASAAQLQQLDQAYALANSGNNEIAFRFYLASAHAGYDARGPMQQFLMNVGRRRFVVPLYTAMLKRPADKAWALAVYAKARPHYHPIAQAALDKLLAYP